jgi:hypothetical protein
MGVKVITSIFVSNDFVGTGRDRTKDHPPFFREGIPITIGSSDSPIAIGPAARIIFKNFHGVLTNIFAS